MDSTLGFITLIAFWPVLSHGQDDRGINPKIQVIQKRQLFDFEIVLNQKVSNPFYFQIITLVVLCRVNVFNPSPLVSTLHLTTDSVLNIARLADCYAERIILGSSRWIKSISFFSMYQNFEECSQFTHYGDSGTCFAWDVCTTFSPFSCSNCIR